MLTRLIVKELLRHPWQFAFSVVGIVLGVAVVTAVDLAAGSALSSFEATAELLSGKATHSLSGGREGVPDAVYVALRKQGLRSIAPVVEGQGRVPDHQDARLNILGVDPFADGGARGAAAVTVEGGNSGRLLTEAGSALLSADAAHDLGIVPGSRITVAAGGREHRITVIGVFDPPGSLARAAFQDTLVMDIATAQEVLDSVGRLSRVDLVLSAEQAARVQQQLPAGLRLGAANERSGELAQLTASFRLNLQALGLLALLVGAFLVYNAMVFSVVRRRELLGLLRALGVTRREVFGLVIGEALAVGTVGLLAGLALGTVLAGVLIGPVTRTMSDLYLSVSAAGLFPTPGVFLKGVVLGLIVTVAAALLPAWEAAAVAPRAAMSRSVVEGRRRRGLLWGIPLALALLAVGGALLAYSGLSLFGAFAALFLILIGMAVLTPPALVLFLAAARRLVGVLAGSVGRMAARGPALSLSRTGVAVAALAVAVAATVGIAVMIDSFRITLSEWLSQTLRADVYVSPRDGATWTVADTARLSGLAGVAAVSTGRRVRVMADGHPTTLFVLHSAPRSRDGFRIIQGDPESARAAFAGEQAVLVSEPYARRHQVGVGDTLMLTTDGGDTAYRIAGVYTDYGSDQGVVAMSRANYQQGWRDLGVDTAGIYLAPGADLREVQATLRRVLGEHFRVRANGDIQAAAMEVFERTFSVTQVLRALAVLIAFVGIASALAAIQLERRRELAVLRCLGLTPVQVGQMVTLECALMGLAAGLMAVPMGLVLALVLTEVINPLAFGWSLAFHVDPRWLLQGVALALVAALVAGAYPAWRMARAGPVAGLRGD
ncbi:MAG TPA: FtsX-like permease family protein [Gammaproteobacteria bacterium]|nr:FtsX-like permease family protein [Gammaproteobacteria bacterium]